MSTTDLRFLSEFAGNEWFTRTYWPENKARALSVLLDFQSRLPAGSKVFDVGCANGYISLLLADNGFKVSATDAWIIPARELMFGRRGIHFFPSNLNELHPFTSIPDGAFDGVVLGEVIEHILNYPAGLLSDLRRILRKDGVMILTTPNPSTVQNALRVLLDQHSLWGTLDFASKPKFDGNIIDAGDIHFREYRTSELTELLRISGFTVESIAFLPMGISSAQPALKRFIKATIGKVFAGSRLFGCCQYLIARPAE